MLVGGIHARELAAQPPAGRRNDLRLFAERRSTGGFLGAILGGMLGRMFLMLGAVVVAVVAFDQPRIPLAISLLAYFTVLLVLELSVLHRHTPQPAGAA